MRRTLAILTALAVTASTALTGACGSDGGSQPSPAGPDRVKVGLIAIVDVAPIYLGRAKGLFTRHGIDVVPQPGSGGAATVPGVVSGQFDFGFANVASLLVARDQGLPLKMIANGNSSTGIAGRDFSAVVVRADSQLRSPRDLAGRTVSVNNLRNIGDTTVRASVRKDGGDPGSVKFLELAFPDAVAAVGGGRVDAAWLVEPFLSVALGQGMRVVSWNMVDTSPQMTVAGYFTTQKMINEKPDLVRRFTAAINESLGYAQEHPDEVRGILATYTQVSADVREKMTLPGWPTEINRASIEQVAGLAHADGLIHNRADLGALLP